MICIEKDCVIESSGPRNKLDISYWFRGDHAIYGMLCIVGGAAAGGRAVAGRYAAATHGLAQQRIDQIGGRW